MLTVRYVAGMFSVGMIILGTGTVPAQNYPSKPIRMITGAPGGAIDFVARLIAPELTTSLGQQVIVDNRGSASGVIAAQTAARASPDGYTLLLYGSSIWLLPFMRDKVPYDPLKDFSPITLVANSPNVLVVHPSLAIKSTKELIGLAKASPGKLNYGSGATGASGHLAGELFNAMAGVNIVRIPYKGGGPALIALVGGQVQMSFPTAASAMPHVKSGRLKALAVTSAQPSMLFPGLPTVAADLPDYESGLMAGVYAPAKTSAVIIIRLHQEIVRLLNKPEYKERFLTAGLEITGSSPEQLMSAVKSDIKRMGKVIKDAGIRAE